MPIGVTATFGSTVPGAKFTLLAVGGSMVSDDVEHFVAGIGGMHRSQVHHRQSTGFPGNRQAQPFCDPDRCVDDAIRQDDAGCEHRNHRHEERDG
jgi:hypothetical protein